MFKRCVPCSSEWRDVSSSSCNCVFLSILYADCVVWLGSWRWILIPVRGRYIGKQYPIIRKQLVSCRAATFGVAHWRTFRCWWTSVADDDGGSVVHVAFCRRRCGQHYVAPGKHETQTNKHKIEKQTTSIRSIVERTVFPASDKTRHEPNKHTTMMRRYWNKMICRTLPFTRTLLY